MGNLEVNLSFIKQVNLLQPECTVHEFGCGIGTMVRYLNGVGCDASGSDISPTAIEYGLKKYPGTKLHVHSAENLPYTDEMFDAVLSFDVLEHLFHVDQHLKEVRRVLKPSGFYIFQTPNKYFNATFETLRKRNLTWKQSHPSLHSPRQLKKRFQKHGFSLRLVRMNPSSDFFSQKLGRFSFLSSVIKYVPFRYLPLLLQTNLYAIAQKLPTSSTV
ncbi:MAG: class I SAM-dependent methyltransferase [Planctomycetes bacterium]|nr:class I SAM-dependent methyltransferase [Planctomycetota bacterium]